jgi:hypothetical protein
MNAWLTVLKHVFIEKRGGPYFLTVWLVGATAMTAALWPECQYPFQSMGGMAWRLTGVLWITLGVGGWGLLRRGLDVQLSAAAVQLVPGLRRAAIIVTTGSWLVMATVLALETCVYGVPFPWILAALLVVMAITVSRNPNLQKIGLLLPVVVWPPIYGAQFVLPVGPVPNPSLAWAAVLLAIAMGTMFIVTELGKSAEMHGVLHGRLTAVSHAHGDREVGRRGGWDAILKRPKIFQWTLGRILCVRSPVARMLHGLGPAFHWSQAAVGGIWQTLPVCLFMYFFSPFIYHPDGRSDHWTPHPAVSVACIGTFLTAINLADYRMRELYARRKEQTLLVILPGAPRGRGFNRWLIQTLILQHAIAIVSALWFVLVVAVALQEPLQSTMKLMAPPLAASLLTTVAFVRDYASMRQPPRLQYTVYAIIVVVALYWAVIFGRGINAMTMVIVVVLLTAILTAWRYARLADAPTAFPVGRLEA